MPFLALLGNKFVIIGIAVLIGLGYFKYTQSTITTLKANNAVLETVRTTQVKTIQSLQIDIQKIQKISKAVHAKEVKTQAKVVDLRRKLEFSKNQKPRDLNKIAKRKPMLLAKILNRGSSFRLRCLEIASGSIIGPDEHKAKGRQRNNLCPEFFNYE